MIKRKKLWMNLYTLICLCLVSSNSRAGTNEPVELHPGSQPNILIIVSDDQGYGDVARFGNQYVRTPNIDRLAAESVWLQRFYVAPVCAPTRAALMTGRHQFRTGVWDTWGGRADMATEETTIAEYLKAGGYATGQFGKWHLGTNYPFRPQDQGFDTAVETFNPLNDDRLNPRFVTNGVVGRERGRFIDDVTTDEAIRFMSAPRKKPFFAYVAFFMPHTHPFKQIPDKYLESYQDDPTILKGDREIYGMVNNLDENVGRLLGALDDFGKDKDTLVIFLSDNGPQLGYGNAARPQSLRFNFGLKGGKGGVYEGGIRVPAFVRWKGHTAPSSKLSQPISVMDVLPTVLDAAGLKPSERRLDGVSFWPSLINRRYGRPDRLIFQQQQPQKSNADPTLYENATVVGERFKLVFPAAGAPVELYDLIADRGETKNIASSYPDIVEQLRKSYVDWFADVSKERKFLPSRVIVGSSHQPVMNSSAVYIDPRYGFPIQVSSTGVYRIALENIQPVDQLKGLEWIGVTDGVRVWKAALTKDSNKVEFVAHWRKGERLDLFPIGGYGSNISGAGKQNRRLIDRGPLGLTELPFRRIVIARKAADEELQ